jgi:3-hydroxyisobutyrate dehydrogenase-like beta-hydroxyacid dehydrogenase
MGQDIKDIGIGVVGVGRMGSNMARRLKETGFRVASLYDARPEAAETLAAELGCEASPTLAGVTKHAEVVITVVTDDAAMRAIYTPDALLEGAAGNLFINCATVTPSIHRDVERLAEEAGASSLEACMASSITQAREGSLYLMCAGRPEAYQRAEPILAALSSKRRFIGPAGTAGQVKALVNMVMNINTAGLAEGLGLAEALGLDLALVREVFAETGAASRVLQTDGEDMQNREHSCYFSAEHAAKDSGIALELARASGLSLPLAQATLAQYRRMTELGLGGLDKSGIAELTFPGRGR